MEYMSGQQVAQQVRRAARGSKFDVAALLCLSRGQSFPVFGPTLLLRRGDPFTRRRTQNPLTAGRLGCRGGGFTSSWLLAFETRFQLFDLSVYLLSLVLIPNQRHLQHGVIFFSFSSWHRFSPATI